MADRLGYGIGNGRPKRSVSVPCRSITDFAEMKKIHRETLATRARKHPLPAAKYEVIKCGRVVPYYLLSELEKWHSDYEKLNIGKIKS